MDDAIATVVTVTNTSPERAAQYVQLADGDAEQAITLFFENGGADLVGATSSSQPSQQVGAPSSTRGDPENPINLDDDRTSDDNDPEVTGFARNNDSSFQNDAALAQRLQEEAYGESGQEADVRAPIARQTETLLGPGTDYAGGPGLDAINRRMWEMQQRRGRGSQAAGIFNQRETSAIWDGEANNRGRDILAEATGGASEASAKSNTLARLFQPPWDLMFKESWDDARSTGKQQEKWLLVNIQDGSVFACQALNRDMWKNPSVVDTIKENFLFLQYSKDDPRAEPYTNYYFQQSSNSDFYPHVAIVDPRTGEQMKVWSRDIPTPPEFLMQLHEFLDRYSLSHEVRNPVAKRKSVTASKKSVDQMSEEEMMEMAMQQSLASQGNLLKTPAVEDPDDLTRSIGDLRKGGSYESQESQESKDDTIISDDTAEETTVFASIPSNKPYQEPEGKDGVTRIQFRHPSGRVVRRFSLSDPVQCIYEWLKAEPLEDRHGQAFELISMGKNLIASLGNTIEEAGLKQGTVMVEFLES